MFASNQSKDRFGCCSPRIILLSIAIICMICTTYYIHFCGRYQIKNYHFGHSGNTLSSIGNRSSTEKYRIPNIVHFVFFSGWSKINSTFDFVRYISIRSAYQIQKPDIIMFHCDRVPLDQPWFQRLWQEVPLTLVHHPLTDKMFGKRWSQIEHFSDVTRIQVLLKYGGMYFDCDVIVLRKLDALRQYPAVIGKEIIPQFNAGCIMSEVNGTFLQLWLESYKTSFNPDEWAFNSGNLPYQIYLKNKDTIHVETKLLTTPDWTNRRELRGSNLDWKQLYVIHGFGEDDHKNHSPDSIKSMKNTLGEVFRYIYYG